MCRSHLGAKVSEATLAKREDEGYETTTTGKTQRSGMLETAAALPGGRVGER